MKQLKILDSHVHFWNYDTKNPDFDWIGDGMEVIKKSFLPQDLINPTKFITNDFGCVAVQAAENWQETEFLLDLASKHDFIKGVVGWADIDFFNSQFSIFNSQLLKGFRHIIQSKPHGYMSSDAFIYFISKLKNNNYTYDLLLKPHQLSEALALEQEFPNQKFVIDHLAKPEIKNQDFDIWKADIQAFKHLSNVFCKVSGMVTEANWQNWKVADFDKPLDTIFETFGTDRIMYGSDFPVCLLAADYEQVFNIITNYISKLSPVEQQNILANNAMKFYNINL